jgi:hypothetical protein
MRDTHDQVTFALFSDELAPLPSATEVQSCHPTKAPPLSDAERARRYRARKKAYLAALQAQGQLAGLDDRL